MKQQLPWMWLQQRNEMIHVTKYCIEELESINICMIKKHYFVPPSCTECQSYKTLINAENILVCILLLLIINHYDIFFLHKNKFKTIPNNIYMSSDILAFSRNSFQYNIQKAKDNLSLLNIDCIPYKSNIKLTCNLITILVTGKGHQWTIGVNLRVCCHGNILWHHRRWTSFSLR